MEEHAFTIMVVDDDEMSTRALRRTIARLKPQWNVLLFNSPKEAAAKLQNGINPNILLTDFLMPGLNGIELLDLAHEYSPITIRALLTGYNDTKVVTQQVGVVHCYLAKPFTDEHIIELLDIAEALTRLPLSRSTREMLGQLRDLPILPSIFTKLCKLANSPDASLNDIAKIIAQEPYLSSRILQIANSPFLGFTQQTLSVLEASNRLGTNMICALVLALSNHQQMKGLIPDKIHQRIADHAFMHAQRGRTVAARAKFNNKEQDKIYAVCLLSSLGQLVLSVQNNKALIPQILPEPFGPDAVVSAYLLTLWGFEQSVCDLVLEQSTGLQPRIHKDHAAIVAATSGRLEERDLPEYLNSYEVNGILLASLLEDLD